MRTGDAQGMPDTDDQAVGLHINQAAVIGAQLVISIIYNLADLAIGRALAAYNIGDAIFGIHKWSTYVRLCSSHCFSSLIFIQQSGQCQPWLSTHPLRSRAVRG